jgi:hypothetical protein
MKRLSLVVVISLLALPAFSQGTIVFQTIGAPTTNGLTGMPVVAGTTFLAGLYYASDGVTDPDAFIQLGEPAAFIHSGVVNAGTRTTPSSTAPGDYAMCQVRVWESAYGSTYEAALVGLPQNGRRALVGKSSIVRVRTPDFAIGRPGTGLVGEGLRGFTTQVIIADPFFDINDVVVSEGTNGTKTVLFTVTVGSPNESTVSVDFATADSSALAGQDYVATNGTLVFLPGETQKTIPVTITADLPPEPDEEFVINLSNPSNALIAKGTGHCLITEARITGVRVDTAVSFNTVPLRLYTVEWTEDLVTWKTVQGAEQVAGNGSDVTVVDQGSGCRPQRLYRSRLLE